MPGSLRKVSLDPVGPEDASAFQIRSARTADEAGIRALIFSVRAACGLPLPPAGTDNDLFDLRTFYFESGGDFSVLLAGERLIGTVALLRKGREEGELRKMYLEPRYHGRGLGRRLLEHALARARELGFVRVTLETASVLEGAVALYERSGFRRYEAAHRSAHSDLSMVRELDGRG